MEQLNSPLKILDVSTNSVEIFDDSSNDTCSSPCSNFCHSTPIKEPASAPQDSSAIFISSDIEVFDESTTSGEYACMCNFPKVFLSRPDR